MRGGWSGSTSQTELKVSLFAALQNDEAGKPDGMLSISCASPRDQHPLINFRVGIVWPPIRPKADKPTFFDVFFGEQRGSFQLGSRTKQLDGRVVFSADGVSKDVPPEDIYKFGVNDYGTVQTIFERLVKSDRLRILASIDQQNFEIKIEKNTGRESADARLLDVVVGYCLHSFP